MSRKDTSTIEALRIADFSVLGCSVNGENFGFSVGPLGLSKHGAEMLASEVAEAIYTLNSLLLEESGVALKYAEFELVSREKGNFPEAMALAICEGNETACFIVLLEHEKGLVDAFRLMDISCDIMNKLQNIKLACKLSGLKEDEEREVLRRFVERFTRKVYGEASQKRYREKYARDLLSHLDIVAGLVVKGSLEIDYGAKPPKLSSKIEQVSFEEGAVEDLEHFKSLIFTKTALNVLAEDTSLIGRKILSLINDYTVDKVEEGVSLRLADAFWSRIKPGILTVEEALEEVGFFVEEAKEAFNVMRKNINFILYSGEKLPLKQHLSIFENEGLIKCFKDVLVDVFSTRDLEAEVWSWFIKDELTYFLDHAERGLKLFEKALPSFIFKVVEWELVEKILREYVAQIIDPIRRLVVKAFIEKIGRRLESVIEDRSVSVPTNWDLSTLWGRIKDDLTSQLEADVPFSATELLEIAFNGFISEVSSEMRDKVEEIYREINEHISQVAPGVADYLLSHNVLKAFLEKNQTIDSSEAFSQKYFEFVAHDISEFPKWANLAKKWLEAFASSFSETASMYALITKFVDFINALQNEETSIEKPKKIIEDKIKEQQEKVGILRKKLAELEEKKISIEKQIDVLQSQLSSTEILEKNLKTDYSVNISIVKELRESLEAKKKELNEVEQRLIYARDDEKSIILEVKGKLEREINELTVRVQRIISEAERIDKELNEAANSKERFKNALKQLHSDLESITNQAASINAEIEKEEAIKSMYVKFLERYSHTLEERLFVAYMLKTEVLAFARDKISISPSVKIDEDELNKFKNYLRRVFLQKLSYVLLRPMRILMSSSENPKLNYLAMYTYPSTNFFKMIIGNNFPNLKEEMEG